MTFEYSTRNDLSLWLYWFNKFYNTKNTMSYQGKLCICPADPAPTGTVDCWFEVYYGIEFEEKEYKILRRFFPKDLFSINGHFREDGNYYYSITEFDPNEPDSWELKK